MRLLAYDLYPAVDAGLEYVTLDALLQASDVISLHCPLTPDTRHMINAGSIEKMKHGVILINTSRGALVDTPALVQGLKTGQIGGAGLDVYEEEAEFFFEDLSDQVIQDDQLMRLLSFNNVIVTSHQAFFTHEALKKIAEVTFDNICQIRDDAFLSNEICYRCDKNPETCPKAKGKNCF